MLWDHPRVCGENYEVATDSFGAEGITPAYAGKTLRQRVNDCLYKDHPRVCGENRHTHDEDKIPEGSPPRMRGKPYRQYAEGATLRITPAYAGKTHHDVAPHSLSRGSPPRMRGKPPDYHNRNRQVRITPAYAGKTIMMLHLTACREDHPRVCGENMFVRSRPQGELGSPPRMRGKRPDKAQYQKEDRITPAYAGKTTDYDGSGTNV